MSWFFMFRDLVLYMVICLGDVFVYCDILAFNSNIRQTV